MIFTLALARYLSERTAQEDVSAGVPGVTDCTNGLCGQMLNTCTANQPSNSVSYDIRFNSTNTEASSIKLRKVTYQTCIYPRSNQTHKTLYQNLGDGIWQDAKNAEGLPSYACYKVGATVNITPPATTVPSPTSTGGGGGGGATTVPSPTSGGGGATTVPSPTSGGGGATTVPSPVPTSALSCEQETSEVACYQNSRGCYWEWDGSGASTGACYTSNPPTIRPTDCVPTAGNNWCGYYPTPTTIPTVRPTDCVPTAGNNWCGYYPTATSKPLPTVSGPFQPQSETNDINSTASTPLPYTHTFVFGPNTNVQGASKATTLASIANLYTQNPTLMSPSVTFNMKVVAEGVNSQGTTIVNDQIIGKPLSFAKTACLVATPTAAVPVTGDVPNGSFEKARGNFNEGGFINWYFSSAMDKVNSRVHDCNQFGPCVDGNNYAVVVRTIGQDDAHFSSEWLETDLDLSGKTIRVKFSVKSHNGLSSAKLKGLFIQREHPTGSGWLPQVAIPESNITGSWQAKSFDVTFPDSPVIETTRFRIVLRPEMDLNYQLGYYYDNVSYEILPDPTRTPTPTLTPTVRPTNTPVVSPTSVSPLGLTASMNLANGNVLLQWNSQTSGVQFKLYSCNGTTCDPQSPTFFVMDVSGYSYTDVRAWGTVQNRRYQVNALNSNGGIIQKSNIVTVAALTATPTVAPTNTPTTIGSIIPSEPISLVDCRNKTATFVDNDKKPGSNVEYLVRLKFPETDPSGSVIVRDDYPDSLEMVDYPSFCEIKTGEANSAVLGVSDFKAERGSLLISIVLFAVLSGGATYLIITHNKESIKIQLFSEKPYLAALIVTGGVLLIGSVYFMLKDQDVSPTDSSAGTQTGQYLECNIAPDRRQFRYTAKITGDPGDVVYNQAEVFTGGVQSEIFCENSFTIEDGPTNTITPTPTGTIIPTETPIPSETPVTSETPVPSETPIPTETLVPSETPVVSEDPTVTPTDITVGFICGAADVNGDGKFGIFDFGGYQVGFASYYQKLCDDTEEDHISYGACGGKDYDKRGKVDIVDFQSFAQRYNKDTCAL
jgi:hypothetical protein